MITVAVTLAPDELIACARAFRLLLEGVMVKVEPSTVKVSEVAEVIDCEEGFCTAGRPVLLSAVVAAPGLTT